LKATVSSFVALIVSLLFERWLGNGLRRVDEFGDADHPITPGRFDNTDLEGE
jgi:hypothetical protein